MKKIILMLVILMAATLSVHAQCRVSGRNCCYMPYNEGLFLQLDLGGNINPDVSFSSNFAVGYKHYTGLSVDLHVDLQYSSYGNRYCAGTGVGISYEFSDLRRYTGIFYPAIGITGGLSGYGSDFNDPEIFPYVGYKIGAFFEVLPGWLDIGLEYGSKYNFATANWTPYARNFTNYNVSMALRVYL